LGILKKILSLQKQKRISCVCSGTGKHRIEALSGSATNSIPSLAFSSNSQGLSMAG
jgi:hypothetical protein